MKRNKTTIRTKLMLVFVLFTTGGLLALFLFQTIFLDDLYEFMKVRSVKTAANDIAKALETDEVEDYAAYWDINENCEIYIVNSKGDIQYSQGISGNASERFAREELTVIFDQALANGGTFYTKGEIRIMDHLRGEYGDGNDRMPPKESFPQKKPQEPEPDAPPELENETAQTVMYAVLAEQDGTESVMILVTSVITPVNTMMSTLYVQLSIAAIVLVGIAVFLAMFTAKYIARPIIDINHAAKTLASGNYQAPPSGGYREVLELRETLSQTAVELKKSEQLQRDWIANVSHDLRTPLTMIIGYSEAIRDLPGEDSAENIQVVIDEADRLTRLVNDVLDLSKLQSGTQEMHMQSLNITEILEALTDRCRRLTEMGGYRIDLVCDGVAMVSADEVRISQVIYNLLCNALSYTGEERRVIIRQTQYNGHVRVSFTDTGEGIPEEELDNIWQRYYQTHSTQRREIGLNSGLGLSIVYTLVQRHGGICGVDSVLGEGSTFWFELPLLE